MSTTGPNFIPTFHNQNQGLSTYIQIYVTYLFFGIIPSGNNMEYLRIDFPIET